MRELLRGCFVAEPSDKAELMLANHGLLRNTPIALAWEIEEDHQIWQAITGFVDAHGHVPHIQTLRAEVAHDAIDRLERLAMIKPRVRGDFASLLDLQIQQRREKLEFEIAKRVVEITRGPTLVEDVGDDGTIHEVRLSGIEDARAWEARARVRADALWAPAQPKARVPVPAGRPRLDWLAVPTPLRDLAMTHSEGLSADPEMYVLAGLTAISLAAHRAWRVRWSPTRTEPVALWSITVADVGDGKSPVAGVLSAPLSAWVSDRAEAQAEAQAEYDQTVSDLKAQIGDKGTSTEAKVEARAALAKLLPPPPPGLWLSDTTPEACEAWAGRSGGCFGVWTDEGSLLRTFFGGQYSDATKLAFALTAWSGGGYTPTRITRETHSMARTSGVVMAMIQPAAWGRLLSLQGLTDEGPMGRFLAYVADPRAGRRVHRFPPDTSREEAEWASLLRKILDAGQRHLDATDGTPKYLDVTDEAHARIIAVRNEIEPRLAEGRDLAAVRGWANKVGSHLIRIAAIHTLVDDRDAISEGDVEAAVRMLPWLLGHLLGSVEVAEEAKTSKEVDQILAWVRKRGASSFAHRELQQSAKRWKWVSRSQDLDGPLETLVERGILRRASNGKSTVYFVCEPQPQPQPQPTPPPEPQPTPPPEPNPQPQPTPPPEAPTAAKLAADLVAEGIEVAAADLDVRVDGRHWVAIYRPTGRVMASSRPIAC